MRKKGKAGGLVGLVGGEGSLNNPLFLGKLGWELVSYNLDLLRLLYK